MEWVPSKGFLVLEFYQSLEDLFVVRGEGLCHFHGGHVFVLTPSLLRRSSVAAVLVLSAREDRKALGGEMGIFHQLLEKGDLFVRFLVDVGKDVGEAHSRDRGKERQAENSSDQR